MYPRIMSAFAIVLMAVTMLAGGSARADEHVEYTDFGMHCGVSVENDTFEGKIVWSQCWDHATDMRIVARCMSGATDIYIETLGEISEDGLRLRTALDGVETTPWRWSTGGVWNSYHSLFIEPGIPTIKKLLEHSRLEVRIVTFVEGIEAHHNGNIDISSWGEAIAPVRELCGW